MLNMITVKEVGERLGMSKNVTYKLINLNGFPKVIVGRKILIPEEEFEKYMKQHIGTKININ